MEDGLRVGYVVRLKKPFEGIKSGVCAYVYQTEPDLRFINMNSAYLVTTDGVIIGKMNVAMQNEFLMYKGDSEFRYQYDGEMKLKRDWTDGVFKDAFHKCNS